MKKIIGYFLVGVMYGLVWTVIVPWCIGVVIVLAPLYAVVKVAQVCGQMAVERCGVGDGFRGPPKVLGVELNFRPSESGKYE